ncbi:MAG: nitrate reductase molybdenum cofactor assembly chaperone, partial [Acetobacteraceae bacterium]
SALPEIAEILRNAASIPAADRSALMALIDEIATADQLDAEERYVEVFDRGRATSLNLFEHLHGDSRDRGQAMVELKQMYERAGFGMTTSELPDHLPVLLEYLSQRDKAEITDVLGDCAHIVRSIGEALLKRETRYAAVPQAVLRIAGEPPLDSVRAARRPKERLDLDRDWTERPAFEPDAATIAADTPFRHGRTP